MKFTKEVVYLHASHVHKNIIEISDIPSSITFSVSIVLKYSLLLTCCDVYSTYLIFILFANNVDNIRKCAITIWRRLDVLVAFTSEIVTY